jgi:hypothetical protein
MRFPYNSPLRREAPESAGGGPPSPKLPRGTGRPPFFSKRAIFSRSWLFDPLLGDEELAELEELWVGVAERCWRAAMRSLRLTGGGWTREDDLQHIRG